MNRRSRGKSFCGQRTAPDRMRIRGLTGLVLLGTAVPPTWAADAPSQVGGNQVAPNQTIELPADPLDDAQRQAAPGDSIRGTEMQDVQRSPVPDSAETSRQPSRRAHRKLETPGLGSGGETPWYRTPLGSMTIVLGVIGAAYWTARRVVPGARPTDHRALRVLTRSGLGPRQSLALVQVGRRMVLLALSPQRVDRVCELVEPDEVAELSAFFGTASQGESVGFERALTDQGKAFDVAAGNSRRSRPVAELLERLRTLRRSA